MTPGIHMDVERMLNQKAYLKRRMDAQLASTKEKPVFSNLRSD